MCSLKKKSPTDCNMEFGNTILYEKLKENSIPVYTVSMFIYWLAKILLVCKNSDNMENSPTSTYNKNTWNLVLNKNTRQMIFIMNNII